MRLSPLLLPCLLPGITLAHGEFPRATELHFIGGRIPLVETNFGILIPRGEHDWTWVCEEVSGDSEFRAFLPLPTGVWLIGTITGMKRTEDGCTYTDVPAPVLGLYVTQILQDPTVPTRVWASTSTAGKANALFVSEDSGQSWAEGYGTEVFGEGFTLRSFVFSPGGDLRVVGWRDAAPHLWWQQGEHWQEFEIPLGDGLGVFPLAPDTLDEDLLWLRYDYDTHDVLVTATARGEFEEVYTLEDTLQAFSTGPGELLRFGGISTGIYTREAVGSDITGPVLAPEAGCSFVHDDEIYQCGNNWGDGASVLKMRADEQTWEPVQWFGDVHQVLSCPPESPTSYVCGPLWESVKLTNGMDLSTPPPETSPTPVPEAPAHEGCGSGGEGSGAALWWIGPTLRRRRRK